jgi:serine/threonine-protein kinase
VLEAVVQKAMAKAPADRYPSARALADDLMKWRRGEPTAVRPPTRWQKAKRWLRRHRVPVTAAGLLALLAVVVAAAWPDPNAARRAMDRTLAGGEPVTLIGPSGPPAWHRWALGEVPLAESIAGDGACGFQTQTASLLELCPDPKTDRYQLSAEFRHLKEADREATGAGVYVGWSESPGPDGTAVRRYLGFEFDDISPRTAPDRLGVRARDHLHFQTTDRADGHLLELRPFPYPPALREPIPWRRLVIDVSPDGVVARWQDGERLVPAHTVTAADLDRYRADHEAVFARAKLTLPAAVPAWHPRRPLGVYALRGAAAFRNVTLTPTTPSP